MRIGWLSATPMAKTGYGSQTLEIVDRLLAHHEITCIGQTSNVIVWGGRQTITTPRGHRLTILPLADFASAPDIINRCYAEEYKFDLIVGFLDAFGLEYLNNLDIPVIAWIPIDGPFTERWAYYVRNSQRIIAYSKFGYNELMKWFPMSRIDYIPHGIPDDFSPQDKQECKKEMEQKYGISPDSFLVVHIGANVGPRKAIPLMMKTFSRFVKNGHDDAHLFIHTNAYATFPRGYDLLTWRRMIGMEDHIHFPVFDPILTPVTNLELARLHSAADIYWSNSLAEGFGLPIGEAMACGVPVMVPDNSAQKELVVDEDGLESRGFLIDSVPEDVYEQIPVYVPQLPNYPVPDQRSALRILNTAYDMPNILKKRGNWAQEYIEQNHRWDKVIQGWFRVLAEVGAENEMFNRMREAFAVKPTS